MSWPIAVCGPWETISLVRERAVREERRLHALLQELTRERLAVDGEPAVRGLGAAQQVARHGHARLGRPLRAPDARELWLALRAGAGRRRASGRRSARRRSLAAASAARAGSAVGTSARSIPSPRAMRTASSSAVGVHVEPGCGGARPQPNSSVGWTSSPAPSPSTRGDLHRADRDDAGVHRAPRRRTGPGSPSGTSCRSSGSRSVSPTMRTSLIGRRSYPAPVESPSGGSRPPHASRAARRDLGHPAQRGACSSGTSASRCRRSARPRAPRRWRRSAASPTTGSSTTRSARCSSACGRSRSRSSTTRTTRA